MGVMSDYFTQITRKGGGGAHGSPNPDPISDQKIFILHTRFQTWQKTIPVFKPGSSRNYVIIT